MINDALTAFNSAFRQVKDHAWTVGLVLLAVLVLKDQLLQLKTKYFDGHRLASSTTSKGTTGNSSTRSDREEAMRQARLRQQELLNERAKIAEVERKEKQAEERKKKIEKADAERKKAQGTGRTLMSEDESGGGGYNPMQPWSANSRGYRPARRQVRRG